MDNNDKIKTLLEKWGPLLNGERTGSMEHAVILEPQDRMLIDRETTSFQAKNKNLIKVDVGSLTLRQCATLLRWMEHLKDNLMTQQSIDILVILVQKECPRRWWLIEDFLVLFTI